MNWTTLKLRYYLWQKQRAQAGMKKMNAAGKKPTKRSSAKYTYLQNRFEEYGLKFYTLLTEKWELGLDVTNLPISLNDIRRDYSKYTTPNAPEEFLSAAFISNVDGDPTYHGDVHVEVTFEPTADGKMRMLHNGQPVEGKLDFPAEVLGNNNA